MAAEKDKFWNGFARGYSAAREVKPPPPAGLIKAIYFGRADPTAGRSPLPAPAPVRLWAMRSSLREGNAGLQLRCKPIVLSRLNRRAPGIIQTLNLIAHVNPNGKRGERQMRLMALAALHRLITQGDVTSGAAHDIALDMIALLDLDAHPSGWASKTFMTLPSLAALGERPSDKTGSKDRQTGRGPDHVDADLSRIDEVGLAVGRAVASVLHDFVPLDLQFSEVKSALVPTWSSVRPALHAISEPAPPSGRMAWRMMTPGKMKDMVWDYPLADIGAQFGVSDTAVRKFCREAEIPLPGGGYWRMTEASRLAARRAMRPGSKSKPRRSA